jgi:hypothetical protein
MNEKYNKVTENSLAKEMAKGPLSEVTISRILQWTAAGCITS